MTIKAIIFDMDGVLVDSVDLNIKSFNMVLKKYNVKLNKDNFRKYLGKSLKDQIAMWKKDFNLKEEFNTLDFSKEAFRYQLDLMKNDLKPNQDILDLIKAAKKKEIKIAVATSSTKFRAEEMLKAVDIFEELDAFVTAEDVKNHKPAPDVFLKAAELLNTEPQNCIVFEDAVNGIEAAKQQKCLQSQN